MEIKHYVSYNGHRSKDFGIKLYNTFSFATPASDVSFVHTLGVDGALIDRNNGTFDNVTVGFDGKVFVNKEKFSSLSLLNSYIKTWLHKPTEYSKIEFTGDPSYFWRGIGIGNSDVTRVSDVLGEVSFSFNCLPYKYRRGSDVFVPVVKGQIFNNPDNWEAKPIVHIVGSGDVSFTLNDMTYRIIGLNGEIYINSMSNRSYNTKTDLNNQVQFPDHIYPQLGEVNKPTTVNYSGNITTFEIAPYWRSLM